MREFPLTEAGASRDKVPEALTDTLTAVEETNAVEAT